VDRGNEYLRRDGADLEALEIRRLLHLLLGGNDVAKAPAHRPGKHLEAALLHILVELLADRAVEDAQRVLVAPPLERQTEHAEPTHKGGVFGRPARGAGRARSEAHRLD